ncbi:hypothetical protein GGR89_004166 [Sphingomonas trueperi]|uniref:Uncharacterized protein n=1 Tax=Sphingomonas trueperi TaxID=53317 RepID=A0A7X5Y380_9SPHN|nr:hypothetical protein [Sphingomonas trueperi]
MLVACVSLARGDAHVAMVDARAALASASSTSPKA